MQKFKCCKCNIFKETIDFYKNNSRKNGLTIWCKECNKKARKKYYKNNTDIERKKSLNRKKNRNPEEAKFVLDKWRKNSPHKIKKHKKEIITKQTEYNKNRIKNDINYRLRVRLRKRLRLRAALKSCKVYKNNSTIYYLGCSIKEYLNSLFKFGMSFETYGKWHIDHIKPLSKFDLTEENQLKEAFNYKNTQPLWALENIRKGANYAEV